MSPPETPQNIATTISEVTDRATLIIREEIELAKAEITTKVTKLLKGAVVAIAAGIFVIVGLMFLLNGTAWLFFDFAFDKVSFGYFIVAGVLFVLGGLAGFLAAKWIKRGSDLTPELAIDEARKIKETVEHGVGHE